GCQTTAEAPTMHTLNRVPPFVALVSLVLLITSFTAQATAQARLRVVIETDAGGVVGLPVDPRYAHITQFIKDVYLDSQVTIGLLSNVTASIVQIERKKYRAPRNTKEAQEGEILTAAQTAAARNFINEISGSTRMLCRGLLYVGKGNLDAIQEQI